MPSRSDWIQTGLAAVADHGPNGLRIDRLCRSLGVSKGSFHHHFAGVGDFKRAILAAYEALVVEALDQAINDTAADNPKATLANLTAAIASTEGFYRPDLEVAMRAWAFSDPEVRAVQERVDARRLESLQRIWFRILDQMRCSDSSRRVSTRSWTARTSGSENAQARIATSRSGR